MKVCTHEKCFEVIFNSIDPCSHSISEKIGYKYACIAFSVFRKNKKKQKTKCIDTYRQKKYIERLYTKTLSFIVGITCDFDLICT